MRKWPLALLVLALITGGVVLLYKKHASEASAEPIKIGALLSLTGAASAWGQNAERGIELATSEVNAAGGIDGRSVQILYEDTAADPKQTVSAFQLATDVDGVTAIIGPLNQTEVASVIPLMEQENIPSIVPGYFPLQERKNLSNPILVWADAESEAGRMAEYVYGQGIRRVAAVGTLDAWEQTVTAAFIAKFQALGGTVTDTEVVQPTVSDMKLPITKALATKPDAVYLGTYYQFANSTKEIHDLGFEGKLYSIEVDDYLASETSGWSGGLQFIAPDYYSSAFIAKFTSVYGTKPGLPAGQSYDAANILFSFLKQSTNQADILSAMKNFNEYNGVSGELTITLDGRSHLPLSIFQIEKGTISKIESLQ